MRILLPVLMLLSMISYSQCDTSRYKTNIFSVTYKHSDVKYGEAPAWNWPYLSQDLEMDIYEPVGDDQTKRPLMVWLHPGAFVIGDKSADDMVAMCDSFAQRGYVTASLGYRLGFNTLSSSSAERAVYRSVQDLNAGLRYLFENASIYNIDTNFVFLGGSSAGAITVLHTVYMNQSEVPSSVYDSPDLGCISCEGNDFSHTPKITGYASLWGAVGDSTWVTADDTIPGLLIHGTDDAVVKYGVGSPFSLFTLPEAHGSRSISNQLDLHGIEHTAVIKEGLGHEFHGADNGTFNSPPNNLWDTIFNAVNAHFTPLVLPKTTHNFVGAEMVCFNEMATYQVNGTANKVCWNVSNGQVVNSTDSSIQVLWDQVGEAMISYRFENTIGAVSRKFDVPVSVSSLPEISDVQFQQNGEEFTFTYLGTDIDSVEWNFTNGTISSESTPIHTFPFYGLYHCKLLAMNSAGCVDTFHFEVLNQNTAGLNGAIFESLKIYPNPSEGQLNVSGISGQYDVTILDISGKEILTSHSSNDTSITFLFTSGVYFVKIQQDGSEKVVKWIIE